MLRLNLGCGGGSERRCNSKGRSLPRKTLGTSFMEFPGEVNVASRDRGPPAITRGLVLVRGKITQAEEDSLCGTRNFKLFTVSTWFA